MNDTPPPSYTDLLTTESGTLRPRAALHLLACLIDAATEHQDPNGLRHAISIAPGIEARLTVPVEHATLHYYLGNAWSELQRQRPAARERVWEWDQPECEQAILAYRTAIQSEGFRQLRPPEQSSILTNLANLLDHLGRTVEAIHEWDHALQTTPAFGMARGNRAAAHLYDNGHKGLFLKTAHAELTRALSEDIEPHARDAFTATRDRIEKTLTAEYLARTKNLDDYPLGRSKSEQQYRKTMLAARLFLNPLNDLGPHTIAARDSLSTPPLVVKIGEGPYYQGFLNQLKQEFIAARVLYYEGTTSRRPHHADRDVMLTDTLDYPAYGFRTEQVRAAYRLAYSLFDKIAYVLNHYLNLGISENDVFFRRLWYMKNNQKKGLRPEFLRYENLPLRGLYWLAKDLAPPDDSVTGTLDPDARHLKDIRDHLEHKYFKLHEEGFLGPVPKHATGKLRDTLALSLNRYTFEKKCRSVLTLSRAALIYLVLAIHREEALRAKTRPPDEKLGHIRLEKIPDHRKRSIGPARSLK